MMKRTDKEIIEAMTFIKEQHNGEMPYKFGTFECAKMMAKYLKKQTKKKKMSKTKKCNWCNKRKNVDNIYQLGKYLKVFGSLNICTDCNIEKEIV